MAGNLTFAIIKPRAIQRGLMVPILDKIYEAEFRISAMKMIHITVNQAKEFYNLLQDKPFFNDLIHFMASGRIVVMLLEKENAVEDLRKLIGSTDPSLAEKGTIRSLFAESIQANAIHGSDSDENAIRESNFFFSQVERY